MHCRSPPSMMGRFQKCSLKDQSLPLGLFLLTVFYFCFTHSPGLIRPQKSLGGPQGRESQCPASIPGPLGLASWTRARPGLCLEFHGHIGSSPQSGEHCNYFNNFASSTWYLAVSSGLLPTSTNTVWIYVITQMVGIFSLL